MSDRTPTEELRDFLDYMKFLGCSELPPPGKSEKLKWLEANAYSCPCCGLEKSRNKLVFGEGNPGAEIMFVGEAPGEDEDKQGRPFVGRAGELLTKMIAAMGYKREDVYIANILKCRPPDNRNPTPEEEEACIPYLYYQIDIIKPKILVTLGNVPTKALLRTNEGITKIRGKWREYNSIPLMPTYHPSYLLREESKKKEAWDDLKSVLAKLGKKPPQKQTQG